MPRGTCKPAASSASRDNINSPIFRGGGKTEDGSLPFIFNGFVK